MGSLVHCNPKTTLTEDETAPTARRVQNRVVTTGLFDGHKRRAGPRLEGDSRNTGGLAMATKPSSTPEVREARSEEHTSELQSRGHLVCRLLLEKENNLSCKVRQ